MKHRPAALSLLCLALALAAPATPACAQAPKTPFTLEFGEIAGLRDMQLPKAFAGAVKYLEEKKIYLSQGTLAGDAKSGTAAAQNFYDRLRRKDWQEQRARQGTNVATVCAYIHLAEVRARETPENPPPLTVEKFLQRMDATCILTVSSKPAGAMASINHDPMKRTVRMKSLKVKAKHTVEAVYKGEPRTQYAEPEDGTPIDMEFDFTKPQP